MKTFPESLTLPSQTMIGRGAVRDLVPQCLALGQRGLLAHGASLGRGAALDAILGGPRSAGAVAAWRHPGGEPTLDHLEALLAAARAHGAQWIAGVGGGSVMDLAKACAGLIRAPLPAVAYHDGEAIPSAGVPFVAVPTTAGTGSEATTVCVFTNAATGVKKSFRHPSFMARLVILDADLLRSCPPAVIASAGMDAFVHAVESFISNRATWISDQFAAKAVSLIAGSLETAFRGPDPDARENLLLGSYSAGVALSIARLGVVHGLAHPLGARYGLPHGLVCGACLPAAVEFNRDAMGAKYAALSAMLGGDLLARVGELMAAVSLESPFPALTLRDVPAIVEETLSSGSTAANPRSVDASAVEFLLRKIFSVA